MSNLIVHLCVTWAIIGVQVLFVTGYCGELFNGTEGEITSPGFPDHVEFRANCYFNIDVGSGRIELTFQNVSLPHGARVFVNAVDLKVGEDRVQSRVVFTPNHRASIFFLTSPNITDSYKGIKMFYKRISKDSCKFSYKASNTELIRSPGYPNNYKVNLTCVYYIDAISKDHVVQIGFHDVSLGRGDSFTIYDAVDNSVILGAMFGPQNWIKTEHTNSPSIKIVVSGNSASSVLRRYAFTYRQIPEGACSEDYFSTLGLERRLSFGRKPCVYTVRSEPNALLQIWLDKINISSGDVVTITLKSGSIDIGDTVYYLTSNDTGLVRRFDGEEEGCWFEIKQNKTASFDLKFMSYSTRKCPFYASSEPIGNAIFTPGFPDNFPSNNSCEYFIKATDAAGIVHIRFSKLYLSPGDAVTVYDASDGSVIVVYNETNIDKLLVSVESKSSAVRVIFTTANTNITVGRGFKLFHTYLKPDECHVDYMGKSGQFSSLNRSCEYRVYPTSNKVEMKFENIHVPQNSTITVIQKLFDVQSKKSKSLVTLRSKDSGSTRYFKNKQYYRFINIRVHEAETTFNFSFKPFVSERTLILQGPDGTLMSPYYPETYLQGIKLIYHVEVPNNHVMLNFTEIQLNEDRYYSDDIVVYDGNSTKKELGRICGSNASESLPAMFLGSGNALTIRFTSLSTISPAKTFRFKALYSTVIEVNYCEVFRWPNSHMHGEQNLTLPGRTATFKCNEGYIEPNKTMNNMGVTRKCGFSGEWEYGDALNCLRRCPKIRENQAGNSTLRWFYTSASVSPYDGDYVKFSCRSFEEDLIGPNKIICTSHGNYSALPPFCKKRPHQPSSTSSNKAWIFAVVVGCALLVIIITIVVIAVLKGASHKGRLASNSSVAMTSVGK